MLRAELLLFPDENGSGLLVSSGRDRAWDSTCSVGATHGYPRIGPTSVGGLFREWLTLNLPVAWTDKPLPGDCTVRLGTAPLGSISLVALIALMASVPFRPVPSR
jgi:hypothetical protein